MQDVKIDRGIVFDKEAHKYFYSGKELSGITRIVGKRVGKEFSDAARKLDKVMSYAHRGHRIHEVAEEFVREGTPIIASRDAEYIATVLNEKYAGVECLRIPEMLVSDKETVATAIDLVVVTSDGTVDIYDYKTGNFDREYCSWQLGFGKYLFELEGNHKVANAYVIATKEQYVYRITPKSKERVVDLIKAFRLRSK